MKAAVLRAFGSTQNFSLQDLPPPSPQAGEVLVNVAAASVNPVDAKIRSGMLQAIAPPEPMILGCDLAGTVVAIGAGVDNFSVGDEVFGCAGGVGSLSGSYAEIMACDARLLAIRPRRLSLQDCAALPLTAITAWEGVVDRAEVQPGSLALVHGATGGVGQMALQLAKLRGARVAVTASTEEKLAIGRDLGAEWTSNYHSESTAALVERVTHHQGFDLVFDTVGGENVARCLEAASENGTVVSISTRTTADLSPLHAKALSLHVVFMLLPMLRNRGREHHGKILRQVASLIDAGQLRPVIHPTRFSLESVAEAHDLLESGDARGKILIEM